MKKNSLAIIFFFVFILNAGAQHPVTIKGSGFAHFEKVTLKILNGSIPGYEVLEIKDVSEAGEFTFETPFHGSNLYELNFDERDFVHLSVKNSDEIGVIRTGKDTRITGSPSSRKIMDFQEQNVVLQAKHFGQLKKDMDEAMAAGDQQRINELQQSAENAIQEFLVEFRALIEHMGASPEGYFALQYSDFNKELEFIENRLQVFKKEAPDAQFTIALEKKVNQVRTIGIGKMPPSFEAFDSAGGKISLTDYQGKIVLIDFWAYWCRACRVENPKLVAVYEKYKGTGFDILSISQRATVEQWKTAIEKDGTGAWRHVLDEENEISELFSISSLPQNLLLDETGSVIARNIHAEELERILAERNKN